MRKIPGYISRALWDKLPLLLLFWLLLALPCELKIDETGEFHFAKVWMATGLAGAFFPATVLTLCCVRRWVGWVIGIVLWFLAMQEMFVFLHFGTRFSSRIIFFIRQTNPDEASEFLSHYLLSLKTLKALLCSLIPVAVYAAAVPLWRRFKQTLSAQIRHWLLWLTFAIAFAGSAAVWAIGLFTTMMYEVIALPTVSQILFSFRAIENNRDHQRELEQAVLSTDGTFTDTDGGATAIIYVIGESLNKHHTPLYGYPLDTTPRLMRELTAGNLLIFTDAVTPAPATELVMDVVFSPHKEHDSIPWHRQPLTPAIFRHAGYTVTYHDNQATHLQADGKWDSNFMWYFNSEIISNACFDYRNLEITPYDLPFIQKELPHAPLTPKSLSIFHLKGQHSPAHLRVPESRPPRFTTADYAYRSDLDESRRQVVADYDNAVAENDSVLVLIIDRMAGKDAVLIFHSDHGEEVYDYRDNYGRTLEPVTPQIRRNIYEVPMLVYTTPEFRSRHPQRYAWLRQMAASPFNLYDISPLLLHLGNVSTRFAGVGGNTPHQGSGQQNK